MPCMEVFAAGDSLAPTARGQMGSQGLLTSLVAFDGLQHGHDNLTFYLLEWIYFGINKLENSATTRLCFMSVIT